MSFSKDVLSPGERVRILSHRLANLKLGSGDFRPSNRSVAINETAMALEEAKADLGRA